MTAAQKRMMAAQGVTTLEKPKAADVVRITREEFNLLDMQDENTIYYIVESDNSVTMMKGVN